MAESHPFPLCRPQWSWASERELIALTGWTREYIGTLPRDYCRRLLLTDRAYRTAENDAAEMASR